MSQVVVGNRLASQHDALRHAASYLNDKTKAWAYPAYDAYQMGAASGPLTDADLLAPVLLNVQHLGLDLYYRLQQELPVWQAVLDTLAPDASLARASQADLTLIGRMFAGIDDGRLTGAKQTIVTKILHRKRPALIPLYDDQISNCYIKGDDAPVPQVKGRAKADFMPLFCAAVQRDLVSQLPFWETVAALAPGPPITPLRALDIVGWWMGGQ